MFKNIILAVLISIVLTYSLGHLATEWLDMHLSIAEHNFEPISARLALTVLVAISVGVGFIIAFSIFAAVAFALLAAGVGLFVAGISVFWPIILFTLVIYLLVRDKQTPAY